MVLSRRQFHVFRFELLFTGQIEFEEHGALQLAIRESERVAEADAMVYLCLSLVFLIRRRSSLLVVVGL